MAPNANYNTQVKSYIKVQRFQHMTYHLDMDRPFASRWNPGVSAQKNKGVLKCKWQLLQLQVVDGEEKWVLLAGFNEDRKAFEEAPKRHGQVKLVSKDEEIVWNKGKRQG